MIGFDAEKELLAAMGIDAELPDAGCCGMAGSFGYEAGERYRVSMAAGERKLLPAIRDAAADTLIVADGFSCRGQIKAGTQRRGLHLAQVMQLAIRTGGQGPMTSPPEAAVVTGGAEADAAGKRMLIGIAVGGAAAAAGAIAVAAARRAQG